MLRLRTFGGLSIENGAAIGGKAANRRPLALLALLAASGSRGLSRDKILALLWPESDAERGRNSLSQLIAVLRRELAVDDLLLGTSELRVNSGVLSCDVIDFEQRIAAHDLESATQLYTGPFLDGVFLKNASEFEHWVDQERARLRHAQGDALEELAARATAAGDHVSAVRVWRQRAVLEPTDSRAARALMESLVESGDPAGALAHYRVHLSLLRDDLALEPDAALSEFAAAVQRGTSRAPEARARRNIGAAIPLAEQPTPIRAASSLMTRRRQMLLPVTAAAILAIGIVATLSVKSGRFGSGPPAPPTKDSLRLRIVTASTQSGPQDSTLARGFRDAVLAELAKDPWLFVVTPAAFVHQAPFIGLDEPQLAKPDTARKYARKMRTHAIIDFGFSRAANGFVITAEARSASTDSSLGVIAVAAAGPIDLPAAMSRLGVELRERLVTARSVLPPTKWSLNTTDEPAEAIELYVEARSEAARRNYIEAARRAEAAVRVAPKFAQAWRLVHTSLSNAGLSVDGQLNAISAAFRYSDRVRAPYWRLDIVSAYYRAIGDPEGALVFYDSIARIAPIQNTNSSLSYRALRRYESTTRSLRRYVDAAQRRYITEANPGLVWSLLDEGKLVEAKYEVAEMVRIDSVDSRTFQGRAFIFGALHAWDSLAVLGKSQLGLARAATDSQPGLRWMAESAVGRGQFAAYDSMVALNANLVKKHGSAGDILAAQLSRARLRATLAGDTARARAIADSGLAVVPLESLKPMDRPYLEMLLYLASVGDVIRGADVAQEWSRATPTEFKRRDSLNVLVGRGELALASGNAHDALRLFRIADVRDCEPCFYPRYARVFDAMSERDSARVWFELYAGALIPAHGDPAELAHTYLRLGELYEERRDVGAAVKWYDQFTNLWATTDAPVLQARVREVRGRVDRLRKQVTLK